MLHHETETPHPAVDLFARTLWTYADLLESSNRSAEATESRNTLREMCQAVRLPFPTTGA